MSATLLAVSIVDADPPLPEQVDEALRAGADVIELRVDRIGDPAAVEQLLRRPHDHPYILTVRSAAEGGVWPHGEEARLRTIEQLAALRPGYVDVEAAAGRLPAIGGNRLILSHHDFAATPADPGVILDRLAARRPHVVKAAFTATSTLDALRVLDALRRRSGRMPTIALAMGAAGLATRVLARKFGAALTFAALRPGHESAPGQITIGQLRARYRWASIGPRTRVFGVIGWPVGHSRSPQVHNAAMAAVGIDGVYLPMPVPPTAGDLAALLDFVSAAPWLDLTGLSITIPHKEHAARWLQQRGEAISPVARRCGAVNTLVRCADGRWRGENTDAAAVVDALRSAAGLEGGLRGVAVDVLGAGGVARAAAAALLECGCEVTIYNRTATRAARLAADLGCRWSPWEQRVGGTGRVLINCTSVGMTPRVGESPVPAERLRPPLVVFDTVYTPWETRLLREAAAAGCATIDGETLFLGQAAAQFALWHDRPAPHAAMRAAL